MLLESWGVPWLSRALITQTFSWVLALLIKDIIPQQKQPYSQHDWECLINTTEKGKHRAHAKSLKTTTSITVSTPAFRSPKSAAFYSLMNLFTVAI